MSAGKFDAIVVGAGHNGLVAACYLARAGRKVQVLERNDYVGGAAVSRQLFENFTYSNCSYVCSLLRPEIMRALDLPAHGLQIIPYDGGCDVVTDLQAQHRARDGRRPAPHAGEFPLGGGVPEPGAGLGTSHVPRASRGAAVFRPGPPARDAARRRLIRRQATRRAAPRGRSPCAAPSRSTAACYVMAVTKRVAAGAALRAVVNDGNGSPACVQ